MNIDCVCSGCDSSRISLFNEVGLMAPPLPPPPLPHSPKLFTNSITHWRCFFFFLSTLKKVRGEFEELILAVAVFARFEAVKTSSLFTFFHQERKQILTSVSGKMFFTKMKKERKKEKKSLLAMEPSHAFRSPSSMVSCLWSCLGVNS